MGRNFSSGWKILVAFVCAAGLARGEQVERPVLAITNVVAEQLYAMDSDIVISGTLCDDAVVLATGAAKITGTVSNDLWMVAGQGAEMRGVVGDHARFVSLAVVAAGTFGRDLDVLGKSVSLATNNIVRGDLDVRGGDVVIEGEVHGRARVWADEVTISAHIRGNAEINATKIELMRGTQIDGDLVYTSPDEVLFSPAHVKVGGRLVHNKPPPVYASQLVRFQLTLSAALIISALMTGGVFLVFFPRFAGNTARILRTSPMRCATTGFFVAGIVAIFALVTIPAVIVAPFGMVLLAVQGVLMYIGTIVVAVLVGGVVMRQQGPQHFGRALLSLTIGLGVLYAAKSLPFLGGLISLLVWFTGAGALILNMVHGQRTVAPPPVPPGEKPAG